MAILCHLLKHFRFSSSTLRKLQTALSSAMIEPCLSNGHVKYVPLSKLNELITKDIVQDILLEERIVDHKQAGIEADKIVETAKRLFAILVSRKKGSHICRFLNEDITDSDLPFIFTGSEPQTLQTSGGRDIISIRGWTEDEIKCLEKKQWRMMAPVFEQGAHYEFPKLQILPFMTPENRQEEEIFGGFSVVSQACIHPFHHNFRNPPDLEGREVVVAVKKLFPSEPSRFTAERNIHTILEGDSGPHSHLTNLLFTFKHGNDYHLVFPWADSNLRAYWKNTALAQLDDPRLLWSLKQMTGIAGALSLIHGFLQPGDSRPNPLFGHHGDIKAENILWFAPSAGNDDPDGILRITDLGLASLHRMGPASDIDPAKVIGTHTYSPPDKIRNARISRKWDIWSLGCLYLEFITWIVLGSEAIEEFSDLRGSDGPDLEIPELSSDHFYTVDCQNVRLSVERWVTRLVDNQRCSDMLYDLLKVVILKMIRIEPDDRSSSQDLHQELSGMVRRASTDKSYRVKTTERPPIRSPDGRAAYSTRTTNGTHIRRGVTL